VFIVSDVKHNTLSG